MIYYKYSAPLWYFKLNTITRCKKLLSDYKQTSPQSHDFSVNLLSFQLVIWFTRLALVQKYILLACPDLEVCLAVSIVSLMSFLQRRSQN